MTLDELRAEILRRRDEAQQSVARWQGELVVTSAELRAHDAAVEAAREEALGDHPGHATRLGPDNLNAGRTTRRNIPEVVYELLTDSPLTTDELIEAVGDVRIGQIQAALLKLGDKVTTKPVQRMRNGYSAEVPGYIRSEEPQENAL